MASTLTLTFIQIPPIGDSITVKIDTGAFGVISLTETIDALRTGPSKVTQGGSINAQATNYSTAWNLDYGNNGGSSNLQSYASANQVIITLLNDSWQFLVPIGTAIASGDVTYSLNNDPVEGEKKVSVSGYTAYVTDPCASIYVNVNITGGDGSYDVYYDGVLKFTAISSPVAILIPRGVAGNIQVYDSLLADIGNTLAKPPRKIIANDITVDVVNLTSGSSITATVVTALQNRPLQYSLTNNGIDWQNENVFTGLAPDTYTVYVKDVWGCIATGNAIIVDGVTVITETIFDISDINALRFALLDETGKKNHKNTLSCGEVKQLAYPFYHKFTNEDIIPTQFKTNAAFINAFILNPDKSTTSLTTTPHSENIGLEAKSTATHFSLGGGRSAIYFGVVDILNPINDAVLDTVNFGFSLPEWANVVGNYLVIDGIGELPIDAIGYSDTYESFVVELNYSYTGVPVEVKVSAIYNLQPYEVYEFNVFMNAQGESFNVIIEVGSDANNIDFTYISERVKKVVDSDKLIEINYSDIINIGKMVYATGIKHKLRLDGYWDYLGDQKTEGYDGDSDYFVTDNTVYDSQKFTFVRLSSEMAHKLRLVVAHSVLEVNGLFYKISEVPEVLTNPNNNLKTFSVTLKRSGDQFLADGQEIITTNGELESIAAGIEASQGKAMILWTKNNG